MSFNTSSSSYGKPHFPVYKIDTLQRHFIQNTMLPAPHLSSVTHCHIFTGNTVTSSNTHLLRIPAYIAQAFGIPFRTISVRNYAWMVYHQVPIEPFTLLQLPPRTGHGHKYQLASTCDHPACVNPMHLVLTTLKEKKRMYLTPGQRMCDVGHLLTTNNIGINEPVSNRPLSVVCMNCIHDFFTRQQAMIGEYKDSLPNTNIPPSYAQDEVIQQVQMPDPPHIPPYAPIFAPSTFISRPSDPTDLASHTPNKPDPSDPSQGGTRQTIMFNGILRPVYNKPFNPPDHLTQSCTQDPRSTPRNTPGAIPEWTRPLRPDEMPPPNIIPLPTAWDMPPIPATHIVAQPSEPLSPEGIPWSWYTTPQPSDPPLDWYTTEEAF